MQESDNILALVIVSIAAAFVAAATTLFLLFVLSFAWCNSSQVLEEVAQSVEADTLEAKAQASSTQMKMQENPRQEPEQEAKPEPVKVNASIEECLQYPDLAGGCEIATMTSVLRALGFDLDLVAFAEDYVLKVKGEPNMVQAYAGDPYFNGAAFPPAMTHAGNNYLREQQADWRFIEYKDLPFDELLGIVRLGRPVLVWTTMYGNPPMHSGVNIEDYLWYDNEHCVVFYGEAKNGNVLIMDPLEGCIEREYASFKELYEACGFHAVSITQTDIKAIDKADADKVSAYEAQSSSEEVIPRKGEE